MENCPDHASVEKSKPTPLDWLPGNKHISSLVLKRACMSAQGQDASGFAFEQQIRAISRRMPTAPFWQTFSTAFALDETAQKVIALIALADQKPELSGGLETHSLSVQGRATRALVCDVLGDDAEGALSPGAPLLNAGLIFEANELRVWERPLTLCRTALEALWGRFAFDPIWMDCVLPPLMQVSSISNKTTESLAINLGRAYLAALEAGTVPVFYGDGPASAVLEPVIRVVSEGLDLPLMRLDGDLVAAVMSGPDRAEFVRAITRDLRIIPAVVSISASSDQGSEIWKLAASLPLPSFVIGATPPANLALDAVPVNIPEQVAKPRVLLSEDITGIYALTPGQIHRAENAVTYGLAPDIWTASHAQADTDMGVFAQKIDVLSAWQDLVLPPAQQGALEQMGTFLRDRQKVNMEWGFNAKSPRGLGMSALFFGGSGTGKTTAAEALIHHMRSAAGARKIDLYRVNVAALVSKYIGETSKNFQKVFEAGASCGAALLFDEAEGLFGKRSSQNRDSLDKHANAELGFLLQCLESYPGISILTTNMREAIDDAFYRRFRFAIEFPFPDREIRAAIWARVLPDKLPVHKLDIAALSKLSLSGGNIRSVAINGAYLAAGDGGAMEMRHLAQAARLEFAKLEKPVPEREISRWAI